jgi:integrase
MAENTRKTGQIIKRGNSWRVIVFLGRDEKGKRRYDTQTVKGLKSDAQQRLNEMLRDTDLGLLGDARKQTLNEYLDNWLETIAKPRLQHRTFEDYESLMRRYVREPLGNFKLSNLKSVHIQKLYAQMQTAGLSARVVKYTHAVLRSALQHAVKVNMLPRNEAQLVQLPKQTRKEMDVLNQREVAAFLDALQGERLATMFSFALATGCRPEEYLAIQWKDIDFEKGRAIIRRALITHRKGGGWHFSEPKTKQSRRTIPLPASTIRELRTHRIQQLEAKLKLGADWNDYDLVFASEVGTPLNPPNITRAFKKALGRAGIRTSIRLYDLRHTTATLLLQAGVNPKVVSERLGHSTIVLTLDVYSHVLPSMQQDATAQLERMIFKKVV